MADLVLYPIARGAYEVQYGSHVHLWRANIIMDCDYTWEERTFVGTKYYCFTNLTDRKPAFS